MSIRNVHLKRVAALIGALAVAAAVLVGCSAGSGDNAGSSQGYRSVDQIKESGTIKIGVFSDKSPFGYVDEHGEYQGYDIELAKRLGEDLGVNVEFVSTEAANRVEYLKTGKVDVILANFTVTPERAEQVDYALPYMNVAMGAVTHTGHEISSLEEVGDRPVIIISGTTAETFLTKNYPNLKMEKYDTYATAKTAFENKDDAVWVNDNTEVIAFAKAGGSEYNVGIDDLGTPDTIAPAVTKGNTDLLNWLNDELVKLGSEQFFHGAYEKTLVDTYGTEYESTLVIEPTK